MPFQPTGFSKEIFEKRYALPDETWEQFSIRVASHVASPELDSKKRFYIDKFSQLICDNKFIPGGRICYGSGRHGCLLNCFTSASDMDSKEGWATTAHDMIMISMSGGGLGLDFSDVRPNGSSIGANSGTCPGPVSLMELVNAIGHPVRSGGGRRVALMFSLDLDHPDIEEFLNAKLTQGKLTLANVSVRCKNTNKFIEAVKKDLPWELKHKGKHYKTISAKKLWDTIVKNAYDSAEPGFLNLELAEANNNIWYTDPLYTTNPCGEIFMGEQSVCCLGHIVLPRFVDNNGSIDWHDLAESVRLGVRFLDNVLSVNKYPLPEIETKSHNTRRIGLGTTGLGDFLILRGLKYGTPEALKEIDTLYKFIAKISYEASALLAIEKGPFPWLDVDKFLESAYMQRHTKKIRALVKEHGIRNCAILTNAPCGTVSIVSGNCSSGLEPIFAPAYERRYWVGDKRTKEVVVHPLFKKFYEEGKPLSHFVASHELTVRQHLEVQATVQEYVDQAISKTCNIPKDYPMENLSDIWLEFLPKVKGTTFYREGSRGYVNGQGEVEEPPLKPLTLEEAKKHLSKDAKCDVYVVDDCPKGVCELIK